MRHQQAIQLLQTLPPKFQQEVFDFIEFLAQKATQSTVTAGNKTAKRGGFGSLKGKIWMREDFDAPLEDFQDYQ